MADAQCRSQVWLRAALAVAAIALAAVAAPANAQAVLSFAPELSATGLGQGTTLTARLGFTGSEYLGSTAPLTGLKLTLPAGIAWNTSGFASCEPATLDEFAPGRCPADSVAGEKGISLLIVTSGGERVEERAETGAFFASDGGLWLWIDGHSPVSVAMALHGVLVGNVLAFTVPVVGSGPGGADVSFKLLTLNLGIARAEHGASVYSLRMPEECPQGKFTWGAEAALALEPYPGVENPLLATAQTACPEHSSTESSLPGTEGLIVAPSNKQCVSSRDFIIHIQQIKGVTYRSASVYVNGNPVDVAKGARFRARVDLRGLPKGRYTVKITVTTTSGRQITGTRAYHTCAPKPISSGKPRL